MTINREKLSFVPYKGTMKIPQDFGYDKSHKALIDFFNKQAKKCTEEFVSKIFVLRNIESEFVGFIATSLCSIGKQKLLPEKSRGMFERPAIRIGQLIIDKKFRGRKFGATAIKFIISIARLLSIYFPCRLLVVDAIDESAKSFYQKLNFIELPDDDSTLVLDLAPIFKRTIIDDSKIVEVDAETQAKMDGVIEKWRKKKK